jgi:uncharacterized protein DUF4189
MDTRFDCTSRARRAWFFAVVGLGVLVAGGQACAEGALAISQKKDIAKSGLAIGLSSNYGDKDEARKRALDECHGFANAPKATRDTCDVILSFRDQCVAISLDPKDGTPGFGWAVADKSEAAQSEALSRCVTTAGKTRQKFCQNSLVRCDAKK